MGKELDKSLWRIVKGSGLVFVGTIVALVLNFFSKITLAKAFTVSEYGGFNLAMAVLSFLTLFALMGLSDYVPREISYYKVKDPGKVERIISASILLAIMGGIAGSVFLYLVSNYLSSLLHEPSFSLILKILSVSLPFQALLSLIVSIFRGFGKAKEKVYFQDIIVPSLWLAGLLAIYYLKLPFIYTFFIYDTVYIISFIALLVYIEKLKIINLSLLMDVVLIKNLLSSSLPLLLTGTMSFIMNWTDTLMLGYFRGPREVGVYNAAAPLASF